MKEIKAIVQPFKLGDVVAALHEIEGLPAVVTSGCTAHNINPGQWDEEPKIKIEIMVPDPIVDLVVEAIRQAAHTGHPGDGRIHVIPIEDSVLIRTGEHTGEAR